MNLFENILGVVHITDKLRENRLRWYGHVFKWPVEAHIRKVKTLQVKSSTKKKGKSKKCLIEIL